MLFIYQYVDKLLNVETCIVKFNSFKQLNLVDLIFLNTSHTWKYRWNAQIHDYRLTTLQPILKDPLYNFPSFHYALILTYPRTITFWYLPRVDMLLWAPVTKKTLWTCPGYRTWCQFEFPGESDPGYSHRAELDLWNQSHFFSLLFSIWLSGRFLPSPHPPSPRNDLLPCLVWPVLQNPLSCHNDALAWSVNVIKSLCMPFEYFLKISWAF